MGMEGIKTDQDFKKDPEFEREKKNQEWKNKNEVYKNLALKFSDLIKENPIVVYTQHGEGYNANATSSFDTVKNVETDETGTGGCCSIDFGEDWISVGKNGARCSHYFDKKTEYYKITKESLSNIMRMMDEMINRSGYSDQEKAMMSRDVFDNFRNKIIKQEDLEKINN